MRIRRLPELLINRIAAGEVVERPASAVKELVENSLDAGSTRIEITLREGGRALISVTDDGCGMTPEEMALAVERHATSKLADEDLSRIATLGFRGEALPSIGAVSLADRDQSHGSASAWTISVEGGRASDVRPAAHPPGTRVEVRDLFFATPARLKFLKAAPTEVAHTVEAVNRLAMARPEVGFTLTQDGRSLLALPTHGGDAADARLRRLDGILGKENSPTMPSRSRRSGRVYTWTASPGCRPFTGGALPLSSCSSTTDRCATGCCTARCAAPTRTSWRTTGIRWWRCSS